MLSHYSKDKNSQSSLILLLKISKTCSIYPYFKLTVGEYDIIAKLHTVIWSSLCLSFCVIFLIVSHHYWWSLHYFVLAGRWYLIPFSILQQDIWCNLRVLAMVQWKNMAANTGNSMPGSQSSPFVRLPSTLSFDSCNCRFKSRWSDRPLDMFLRTWSVADCGWCPHSPINYEPCTSCQPKIIKRNRISVPFGQTRCLLERSGPVSTLSPVINFVPGSVRNLLIPHHYLALVQPD